MNAYSFLNEARHYDKRIDSLTEQIFELHTLSEKCTTSLSEVRVSNNQMSSRVEDAVTKIIDYENELVDMMNELTEKKKAVGIMIAKIEDPELRVLLEYRYLCNMTFEAVAAKMHYSIKWIQKKHAQALSEFERVNLI